jgi:anti-sigma B factor antagonist
MRKGMVQDKSNPRNLLRVALRTEGDTGIISLQGELDMATVDHLDEAFELAAGSVPAVLLVDLRELTFMDSAGLAWLLGARERCRGMGCRLVLVRAGRSTQRLLQVAGVEGRFEFVDDPAQIGPTHGPRTDGASTRQETWGKSG